MKSDWITIIIVVVMTLCLATACFYYYEKKINTCSSNPLVYASNMYTEQYGYEFVGYGWFMTPINLQSPRITFNSTSINVE